MDVYANSMVEADIEAGRLDQAAGIEGRTRIDTVKIELNKVIRNVLDN
jgi:hypothetical protein